MRRGKGKGVRREVGEKDGRMWVRRGKGKERRMVGWGKEGKGGGEKDGRMR